MQTWRELLGRWIDDPHQRRRIANELGVSPITLTRWQSNESTPRPQNLRKLLTALPQQRELLLALLEEEFNGFTTEIQDDPAQDESSVIPSEFYMRVLHTSAHIPKRLRFPSLCDLILQEALEQLDPRRLGMVVIVAICMPPSDEHPVRSLRESVGRGTPPWEKNVEQHAIFLGAESLTGSAVVSVHLQKNQKLNEMPTLSPGYQGLWEESAVAVPIMQGGAIAGGLLVSSTQPDYFVPSRCSLVEAYAELLAVAFAAEDFYEPQRIELGIMPPAEVQQSSLSAFRQRVIDTMIQATRDQRLITVLEAEQVVWQQLEKDLLQRATHRE